jgi:hypothetical protein
MGKKIRNKLGNLIDHADRTVAEMIRERGGNASNVREAGSWAYLTLEETAEAAVNGDRSAGRAIKIVKDAFRLGRKYGGDAS